MIKIKPGVKMNQTQIEIQPKIFGIGLDRTGTTSLAAALNQLGIPTLHYAQDSKTQQELLKASRLTILEKYQGIIHETSPFYQKLDALYPGSKFILTVREKEQWLKSVDRLFEANSQRLTRLNQFERQNLELYHELKYGLKLTHRLTTFDSTNYWKAYQKHQNQVLEYFSDRLDDLLMLHICAGEGWEKLCPFLGIDIPETAFPHEHTGQKLTAWNNRVEAAWRTLETLIPEKSVCILVDECQLELSQSKYIPFLEKNGKYWGLPSDSAVAISELERMRQLGCSFIAFVWLSFWWLEHYSEFAEYLQLNFSCVLKDDLLIVFDLRSPQ